MERHTKLMQKLYHENSDDPKLYKNKMEFAIDHTLERKLSGRENVQEEVMGYLDILYATFLNIIPDMNDDFIVYKKLFFKVLEEKFEESFEKRNGTILAACYAVNNLSLKEFQDFCENFNSFKIPHIFKIVCFLLKKENLIFVKGMTGSNYNRLHEAKLNIISTVLGNFKDYLEKGRDMSFFISCANIIGEYELMEKMKSYETNPLEINLREMRKAFISVQVESMFEADGHVYDRPRDPPGQRSVYIAPGNTAQEAYRLSTFMRYPQNIPINQRHLASNGFFYTGYKDRVKCFCCGLCVENWTVGDDPKLPRWHRSDCEFMKGESCGNIPIAELFSRLRTGGNRGGNSISNGSTATNVTQQYNNVISTSANAVQDIQPTLVAGSIFQQPGSNIPMQTARPYTPSQQVQQYQRIDFATMPSSHHEHLVLSLDLRKESDRYRTFGSWPCHPRTVLPSHLAQFGFFYLGNLDRVQCFSCGGVLRNWNFGDNVEVEHRRHFPHCKLVHNGVSFNIPLPAEERANHLQQQTQEPPDPTEAELRNLVETFPCLYPVSPHMSSEASRLETFDQRWSANQVHATPQQIARAGFFFLGDRDRVKCWYCNGGLQNWDPDDEPWAEHAKWFPNCEYLLQRKGHDYVSRMVALYPNLPRPVLRGRDGNPQRRQNYQISFGENIERSHSPPPPIIDPKAIRAEDLRKLNVAMNSDIVKSAVEMGFELKPIRVIVKRRLQNADMFSSVSELVDAMTSQTVNLSDSEDSEDLEGNDIECNGAVGNPSLQAAGEYSSEMGEPMDQGNLSEGIRPSMEARIRELQEERKCKICIDRIADVVFVPCGHLCCCVECVKSLGKCPICRRKIEKSIRTYMS